MSEFASAKIIESGNNYYVSYGDDKGLYVEFHYEPVYMGKRSEEEGRPIYEDKEFIKILFAGDKTKVIYREASDEDKRRFERQYNEWKKTGENAVQGTRLELTGLYKPSEVAELNALKIFSIEQFAEMPDSAMQSGLGFRSLRDKAVAYVKANNGEVTKLASENAALRADLEAMQEQIKELSKKSSKTKTNEEVL